MKAAEREARDQEALRLFIAGASYAEIAVQVNLRPAAVAGIVEKQLAAAAARRLLLSDEAYAVYQERSELLLAAHLPTALDASSPDRHKSALVCQRILAAQAKLLEAAAAASLPGPTGKLPGEGEASGDPPAVREEATDDLARLRAERGLA